MPKASLQVDQAKTSAVLNDDEFKDVLYEHIAKMVRKFTGRVLSNAKCKRIFEQTVELMFTRIVETGYFRFPGGYGSFTLVKMYGQAARVMPDGSRALPKPNRYKIKYKDGVAVMEMLGTSPHKYQRLKPRKTVHTEDTEEEDDAATV